MRTWKMLAAAVGLALSAAASATTFSELVVFGDSLSDPGNAYWLTRNPDDTALFPPTPPYNRRFSNGKVAAEYLAQALGAPTGAAYAGAGNNWAVGGAMTGSGNFNWLVNSPTGLQANAAVATTGIAEQIASFDPLSISDPSKTLFLLWGAPNDFFLAFAQQSQGATVDFAAVTTAAITNLVTDVGALAEKGAQHILVPNMPDLGLTPFFLAQGSTAAASATALTNAFNAGLADALSSLGGSGLDLMTFDTAAFLRNAVANPGSLGFTNVTTSCLAAGFSAFPNCAGYLFFDDVHPTTAAHALLGEAFAQAVPEPETYAMLLAGLGVLGWVARRRGTVFG